MKTGQINVQTENIFPIIKKFLYSDHEIFLRELVANAVDATQKVRKLSTLGDVKGDLGDTTIQVILDEKAKTLTISDKGVGITADEVEKYINQIAFSSAQEFLDKFKKKDKADTTSIIGHFGLGFYSAFMVAENVDIITKSYKRGKAVHWTCDGTPNYTIDDADKKERGTDIVLHINDESLEYLQEARISELLNKYCKFLPVEIQFGTKEETITKGEGDDKTEEKITLPNIINNPAPAWTKSPSDLTDEDYKAFYNELYPYAEPPLFWIHLNVDYPFNLTGVLFFPKLSQNFEVQKNKVQLYSNQVFVTDQVENILPEFLMHLHGVIDSPDIPLNVSRSYLQSDSNVKKINSYITKKVADKLGDLFKADREDFESKWEFMHIFVKYGMISDEKFYDKGLKFNLLEDIDKKYYTQEEYVALIKDAQVDKDGKTVILYTTDAEAQHGYIEQAKAKGYNVLKMDSVIDQHFINQLEAKLENTNFKRVDADTLDKLIEKDEVMASVLSKEEEEKLQKFFTDQISEPGVVVQTKALSPDDQPVTITQSEFMRRMKDMAAISGQNMGFMPDSYNLVVNSNHALSESILKEENEEQRKEQIQQLFDLALLSQGMLKGAKLTEFLNRSYGLMGTK